MPPLQLEQLAVMAKVASRAVPTREMTTTVGQWYVAAIWGMVTQLCPDVVAKPNTSFGKVWSKIRTSRNPPHEGLSPPEELPDLFAKFKYEWAYFDYDMVCGKTRGKTYQWKVRKEKWQQEQVWARRAQRRDEMDALQRRIDLLKEKYANQDVEGSQLQELGALQRETELLSAKYANQTSKNADNREERQQMSASDDALERQIDKHWDALR
ncbi:hypothetical protein CYLTODRAFT_140816 [Cylindrobasidium torrendii FP15055 ss-10]|uniref:Uncharacterized protein n=1 Tax=Cylindrobasidium torrendii FP15055 ss-10 TaxID=1314674 RepID=A0A0D7B1H9_9AGAR|nr:hypothetical protein CYLTODRAFT_140816 [Cylindrobasidium torrendii FP15055 ss-10]